MSFFYKQCLRHYSSCSFNAKPINQPTIGYLKIPKLLEYDKGLKLQSYLVARRHRINQQDLKVKAPNVICLLEHTPTFTAGRRIRGKTESFRILDIREFELNVRCYVSRLEQTIIDCCEEYGIDANRTENTGVWIGQDDKIAALGVQLQRYVSSHGIALNCNVDLSWYDHIVPCGLADKRVTSISHQTNKNISPEQVMPQLIESFKESFSKEIIPIELDDVLTKQEQADIGL
ncbi:hypothetical protein G6F52_003374 [Rhizopus delemar]|nr:hypothetical protein G6F52_003374 [Rhizopus delemar]